MIWRSTLSQLRLNQNYFTSQTFSSVGIHEVAKWQFCSTTHVPSLIAFSIMRMAIGPCPWPNDNELNFDPLKPCDVKEDKTVIQTYSLLQLIIQTLFPLQRSLCVIRRLGRENKSAREVMGGEEGRKSRLFPLPIVLRALNTFYYWNKNGHLLKSRGRRREKFELWFYNFDPVPSLKRYRLKTPPRSFLFQLWYVCVLVQENQ